MAHSFIPPALILLKKMRKSWTTCPGNWVLKPFGYRWTDPGKTKGYGYRFYPDKLQGEGFFLAVLRKKEGKIRVQRTKERRESPGKKEESHLRKFLPDENLQFHRIQEWTHAMP